MTLARTPASYRDRSVSACTNYKRGEGSPARYDRNTPASFPTRSNRSVDYLASRGDGLEEAVLLGVHQLFPRVNLALEHPFVLRDLAAVHAAHVCRK